MQESEWIEFQEEKSHVTDQRLLASHLDKWFANTETIVFVDDELSTDETIINFIEQEKSVLGRLKNSQELDKTDEISMTLWYSVLQVVLYPLLGLIMRGICYGSFLQEVVQIID